MQRPERAVASIVALAAVLAAAPTWTPAHGGSLPVLLPFSSGRVFCNETLTEEAGFGLELDLACVQDDSNWRTEAHTNWTLGPPRSFATIEPDGPGSGNARAILRYNWGIFVKIEPPVAVPEVPMAIDYTLSVLTEFVPGEGSFIADAQFEIKDELESLFKHNARAGTSGADNMPEELTLNDTYFDLFTVNELYTIEMLTLVQGGGPSGFAEGFADPFVRFDQAAFDALMGEDTFPLEEYFGLEFSPGIQNVPAPGSLVVGVLAGVVVSSRRRGAAKRAWSMDRSECLVPSAA